MFSILKQAIFNGQFDFFLILSYLCSAVVVVFISSPVHEYAHAMTAVKLGDPTPKYTGRTTLNPLAHIDYIGALLIFLFGFGWAKPVQVNPRYFKNPKRDMAVTALAGPVSNVLLGFVFYVFYKLLGYAPSTAPIYYVTFFCLQVVYINITLAVFNLIPIPPLDGSRIVYIFLPTKIYFGIMRYERYIMIAMFILLWFGAFSNILGTLSVWLLSGMNWLIRLLPFFRFY